MIEHDLVCGPGRRCSSEDSLPRSRSVDFGDWLCDWGPKVQPKVYNVRLTSAVSGDTFEVNGKPLELLVCRSDDSVFDLFHKVVSVTGAGYLENVTLRYDMQRRGELQQTEITIQKMIPGYFKARPEPPHPEIGMRLLSLFFWH